MSGNSHHIEFEKLFKMHYGALHRHTMNFVRNHEYASDIVNGVYTYVWENRERLLKDKKLLPIMYLLTRNAAIDFLRRKKTEYKFNLFTEVSFSESDIADYLDFEIRVERAMKAVDKLPAKTKLIFKECFMGGMTYREAAEKYNISVHTVRNHIAKALGILRTNKYFLSLFFA